VADFRIGYVIDDDPAAPIASDMRSVCEDVVVGAEQDRRDDDARLARRGVDIATVSR
jgi:hypothetical protein